MAKELNTDHGNQRRKQERKEERDGRDHEDALKMFKGESNKEETEPLYNKNKKHTLKGFPRFHETCFLGNTL